MKDSIDLRFFCVFFLGESNFGAKFGCDFLDFLESEYLLSWIVLIWNLVGTLADLSSLWVRRCDSHFRPKR